MFFISLFYSSGLVVRRMLTAALRGLVLQRLDLRSCSLQAWSERDAGGFSRFHGLSEEGVVDSRWRGRMEAGVRSAASGC